MLKKLTKLEMKLASALLEEAGSQFANHGCNDYFLPNTDGNWALHEAMQAWNLGLTVGKMRKHPDYHSRPSGKDICFADCSLMSYLARRLGGSI